LIFRAINVPLACGDQDPSRAVVSLVVLAALGLDVGVDPARNGRIGAASLVLVDHGGTLAVVSHSGHEIFQPGPGPDSSRRSDTLTRHAVPCCTEPSAWLPVVQLAGTAGQLVADERVTTRALR
jgi:hypothetical protein